MRIVPIIEAFVVYLNTWGFRKINSPGPYLWSPEALFADSIYSLSYEGS